MNLSSSLSVNGESNAASSVTGSTDSISSTSLRPFSKLNLTEDQRIQLRSILHNAKSQGLSKADVKKQIDAVLTPDQQATLAADQQYRSAQLQSTMQNASASGSGPRPFDGGGDQSSTTATSTTSTTASSPTAPELQQQALSALSILTRYIQSHVAKS